uniref:Uncharacterized protein n=1 Tax=Equus asinus TaxID=9793 RepID=A0A9L0JUS9_EQUAS
MPSSFQPVWPVRTHPARSQSPRSRSLQWEGSRLTPWTRMKRLPRPGARASKWSPAPGRLKMRRTVGTKAPASHPAPLRPEFTSVIRAGALKEDLVRPWGLASPGEPPAALLHAGFLPPVVRGLCTPGTIRYGPAELGFVYPHLQRLGPGPGFPEAFYPSLGLPYPGPPGTRVQRKGD